jgi:Rrf2 family cysteine metabolism transcriptional repressor
MKPTLKATYAIMATVDLALQNGNAPVQAKSIARRQAIPPRFLEQVLNALKKAGLVESQRGAQGGYVLNRRPADISLAEIVEALDGPILSSTQHWPPAYAGRQARKSDPILATVWERLREAEFNVLSEVTLKELADRHQQIEEERTLMYHI